MIYLARVLFLVGTAILCLSACLLAAKILFETYIPEPYQGYWVETFIAIIAGTLIASLAQFLGNDLIGPKKAIKEKVDAEYQEFRREDEVTKSLIFDDIFSSFLFLLKNMK